MKERPILFSGPMVCAILEDRKTQTRRVESDSNTRSYGVPGDRLWVRETLFCGDDDLWRYSADNGQVECADPTAMAVWALRKKQHYCSSIFMPRWACRIVLEIVDVRVQRLQDINKQDALAEGITIDHIQGAITGLDNPIPESPEVGGFAWLWDSINGKRFGWHKNPQVRALTFRKVKNSLDREIVAELNHESPETKFTSM